MLKVTFTKTLIKNGKVYKIIEYHTSEDNARLRCYALNWDSYTIEKN